MSNFWWEYNVDGKEKSDDVRNIQAGLCEAFTCTKVSRMERHRNPGGQNMAPCLDPNGTCLGGGLPIGTNCTYKKKVYTPPKFRILNPKKRRSGKCFVFLFQRGDFQVFMFIFLGRCKCGYIYIYQSHASYGFFWIYHKKNFGRLDCYV